MWGALDMYCMYLAVRMPDEAGIGRFVGLMRGLLVAFCYGPVSGGLVQGKGVL